MAEDFFDVLGVSRDASDEEINRAFRKLAAKYHPDVSDEPDAEERFKQIKKAKEVLTDDEKRELYNRLGHDRFLEYEKTGAADAGGQQAGDFFGGGDPFGGDPFGDIFEQFFGNQGGRSRRGRRPQQGADLRTTMRIDLEEAYRGATKRVTIRRPERCDTCGGSGQPPGADPVRCPECDGRGQRTRVQRSPFGRVQHTETCPRCEGEGQLYEGECSTCHGDGVVEHEATLQVEIPPGIRDGQRLRMEGEGGPGSRGGPPGDLLIEVSVADHPEFDRKGDNLYYTLELSFPQAALGDRVTIPTLDGSVEMRVPAGTQSGERFRLDDKGMPRLNRRGRGHMIVETHVTVPEGLSEEQREAIEVLAEAMDEELDIDESLFDRIRGSF